MFMKFCSCALQTLSTYCVENTNISAAKAIRSVSLLKLKAQCAFNASSAASTRKVYERCTRC
ncbi:hypothetical protein HMPREF1585_01144 [Gardnerella vaginalis JCP8481B]|nr:hypothetical protein HMPREF1585_01144 [Gardnerella vaginalis JCP8481B]